MWRIIASALFPEISERSRRTSMRRWSTRGKLSRYNEVAKAGPRTGGMLAQNSVNL
jgi:hypothetical protein